MLTSQDIIRFSEACTKLHVPGLKLESFPVRSFRFWETLIPSEFIAFGSLDLPTQHLDIGFNEAVPGFYEAMEALGELMGKYELFRWDPEVNEGKPFYRSDFYTRREFRKLDIFSEVYQVIGIDDHCAVHIPGREDEICFFGIERNRGPEFSDRERMLIQLGQRHLTQTRSLLIAQEETMFSKVSPEVLAEHPELSLREAEVLSWVSEGKTNDEIAILLGLKLHTVKEYAKNMFRKIGVENRLAAALWAIRIGQTKDAGKTMETTTVPTTGGPSANDWEI